MVKKLTMFLAALLLTAVGAMAQTQVKGTVVSLGKGEYENVKKRAFPLKIYTFFCLLNKNVIYLHPILRYDKTISEDDQSRSNT